MHFFTHKSRSKWNTIGSKFLADTRDNDGFDLDDCEIDTASTPASPNLDDITILDLYAAALSLNSDGESRPHSSNSSRLSEAQSDSSSTVSIDMNNNQKQWRQNFLNFNNRSRNKVSKPNKQSPKSRNDKENLGNGSRRSSLRRCSIDRSNNGFNGVNVTNNNTNFIADLDRELDYLCRPIPGLARRRVSNTSEHTLFTVASLYGETPVKRLPNSRRSSFVIDPSIPSSGSSSFSSSCSSSASSSLSSTTVTASFNDQNASDVKTKSVSSTGGLQSKYSQQPKTTSIIPINCHNITKDPSKVSKKFTIPKNHPLSSSLYSARLYGTRSNRERRRSFGQQSGVAGHCNSLTCFVTTLFSMTLSTLALGAIAALLVFQSDVLALQNSGSVPKVCQTDACRAAGLSLHQSINFTVNPCDDFFEYACGRWIANNPIPDDKSRVGTFSGLSDLVDADIRTVLDDAVKAKAADPNAFPIKALNYGIDMYSDCLDRESIRALGDKPIHDLLKETLKFDWPLIDSQDFDKISAPGKSKLDAFKETWLRLYRIGHAPVFTFVVTPDANDTKVRIFDFDHPGFSLGRKEYKNPELYVDQVKYYKEFTRNVSISMAGNRLTAERQDELDLRLKEMFDFEQKLALASTPDEERRSASVWYNRMNFNNLEEITENHFKWVELVNKFLNVVDAGYQIDGEVMLILDDIPYYKKLFAILEETPAHVLHNYLGYMMLRDYVKYTEGNLKEISLEYSKKVRGVQKELPLWRRCVSQAFSEFSFAISRLYVNKFVAAETKTAATSMIQDLKKAFRNIVQQRDWLDSVTRVKALDKLDNIRENVAYPEWLLNNTKLDSKYGFDEHNFLEYTKGRYMDNAVKNNIFSMAKMYKNYKKAVDVDMAWPMPPAMVNAAYMPTQNSITIPVGILRPPFFDAGRPAYINYGAIGAVIGHEITHGFDDQGAQFDKTGNLVNWWSKLTEKNFGKGAQCFVNQYGSITDKQTGKKLNGVNTQGENIADNGGVRQAFNALQSYAERTGEISKVPHMEDFTHEQMFFLGYASVWCGQGRTQYVKNQIDYDPHSPVRYRVNTVLQNMESFSEAFKCSPGSYMNPTSEQQPRCMLW